MLRFARMTMSRPKIERHPRTHFRVPLTVIAANRKEECSAAECDLAATSKLAQSMGQPEIMPVPFGGGSKGLNLD